MTDRPPFDDALEPEDSYTEYDDVPGPSSYDPDHDDRAFGWEDDARGGRGGGRGAGGGHQPRFAAPRGPGGRRRGPRLVVSVGVVLLLVLVVGGVWVQRQIDPSGSPGQLRTITIPKGSSSSAIGDQLAHDGIITSGFVWDWYLKVNGGGPFEAGDYQLADDSSMGDVVEALSRGPRPPELRRYTMPEGFTVKQTLARLADPDKGLGLDLATMQQLLDSGQVRSAYQPAGETSSEGILFPETYEVEPDATPLQVLQQMVSELDTTLAQLDVTAAQTTYHLSPYEILTIASLIEEETKVPEERPMVARVIFNRIKQGIPLGVDATSRYEAELAGRDRSKVDFTSSSPYNTRKHKGLPPTPIAAPGRASIEAALHPADGDWIYYVLQDSAGHHLFTASNSEFIKAKQRCHNAGLGCG
jgi:UPF0755 protein